MKWRRVGREAKREAEKGGRTVGCEADLCLVRLTEDLDPTPPVQRTADGQLTDGLEPLYFVFPSPISVLAITLHISAAEIETY